MRPYETFVQRCLFVIVVTQLFAVTIVSRMHLANQESIEQMKTEKQDALLLATAISELQPQIEAAILEIIHMRRVCEQHGDSIDENLAVSHRHK